MNLSNRHYHRTQLHHRQQAAQYRGIRYRQHEVHALFNELIHKRWGTTCWTPPVDVWESETAYIIEMDLPGVHADDVRMEAHERTLSVEGQRQLRQDPNQVTAHIHERCEGRFARTFEFDFNVEGTEVAGNWQDGVLTLTVPKPKRE
jgi:HSP20 family protein